MAVPKIAFVHFYTFRMLRGIETLIVSLANELVRLDADVSILTASRMANPLVEPHPQVHVFEFPVPRYFAKFFVAPQYVWNMLRHNYDYVIVFFADFGEGVTWQITRRLCKTKLIVYLCYPYAEALHRFESMAKQGFFRTASVVLADAAYIAQDAQPLVGRPIEVIPVGSDPNRFKFDAEKRSTIRQQFGYGPENLVLLNVSSLEPRKGVWRVIEALPSLLRDLPTLRYLVLGKGEDEKRLRTMVQERNLQNVVTFAGTTTDLPAFYSAADIFVMLSEGEANSVASHEALSCGLPVIASNNGGFLEVMRPEFSWLVDLDQPDQLSAAINTLGQDANKRAEMGRLGRRHIETHLSWRASAMKFLEYLPTVIVRVVLLVCELIETFPWEQVA